jgi:hypothetical protein
MHGTVAALAAARAADGSAKVRVVVQGVAMVGGEIIMTLQDTLGVVMGSTIMMWKTVLQLSNLAEARVTKMRMAVAQARVILAAGNMVSLPVSQAACMGTGGISTTPKAEV